MQRTKRFAKIFVRISQTLSRIWMKQKMRKRSEISRKPWVLKLYFVFFDESSKKYCIFFNSEFFREIFFCFILLRNVHTIFFAKFMHFSRNFRISYFVKISLLSRNRLKWNFAKKAEICASKRNTHIFLFRWKSYFGLELNQQLLKLSQYCTYTLYLKIWV